MKTSRLLLALAPAFSLNAQTNLPTTPAPVAVTAAAVATPATNAPARDSSPIDITSEHGFFDLKNRVVIYSGNVVVTNQLVKLTCEKLTVRAATNETKNLHPDSGIAEGNVRIEGSDNKGHPIRVTSDKAVYAYKVVNATTNETVTLTGNVYVDSAMFKGTGDPIIWDRINDSIHGENLNMLMQPELKPHTNAPPVQAVEK